MGKNRQDLRHIFPGTFPFSPAKPLLRGLHRGDGDVVLPADAERNFFGGKKPVRGVEIYGFHVENLKLSGKRICNFFQNLRGCLIFPFNFHAHGDTSIF